MLARPFVKYDCGRDSSIERFCALVHRNFKCDVASDESLFSNAGTLVADDKYAWRIKHLCAERRCSIHRESVDPKTFFFKYLESVVHVPDCDERDTECHTGRGLHDRARDTRLIMLGDKDTRESEGGGRADNSAHIVRILYFPQYRNRWISFCIKSRKEFIKRYEQGRRIYGEYDALMRCISSHKLFTLSRRECCSRNIVFLQERVQLLIKQIAREEHFPDNARRILQRFLKRVFAVDINLLLSFGSHGAR